MRQPTGDGERLALLPVGRQPGDIGPRHVGILGIYADALAPHATRILQIVAAYIGVCGDHPRSEEHTSELQSLMRISYAVFCLKKKTHDIKKLSSNITHIDKL